MQVILSELEMVIEFIRTIISFNANKIKQLETELLRGLRSITKLSIT